MITLRKNSLLHKLYAFSRLESTNGIHTTSLCRLFWGLLLGLPLATVLMVVLGPMIAVFIGIEIVVTDIKERTGHRRKRRGPSKAKLIYQTVKGKICPTVRFVE